MALDELSDLIDDGDGIEIRFALGVSPGKKAVAAQHHSIAARHCLYRALEHHGKFKARTLPGNPHQLVTERRLNSSIFSLPLAEAASAIPQSG